MVVIGKKIFRGSNRIKFILFLLLYFFIISPIVHESGHYFVARALGYNAFIDWDAECVFPYLHRIEIFTSPIPVKLHAVLINMGGICAEGILAMILLIMPKTRLFACAILIAMLIQSISGGYNLDLSLAIKNLS